jgi:hypothetical protein
MLAGKQVIFIPRPPGRKRSLVSGDHELKRSTEPFLDKSPFIEVQIFQY